jgi:two-component system, NarL family, sensor histidine kinase DesK
MREYVHVDSRLETGQGLPRHLPTDRRNGRRRWSLGALFAQAFLISVYIAIWNSDKPPAVIAGSLALLLAFSLIYIFQVGRIMQAPILHRVLVVAVLFVLTLPQFAVLGPDAAALWIYVGVAGGLVFGSTVAFSIGLALAGLMLLIDALTGQPLSWELALTLVALTAFMVGFAGNVRLNIKLRETQEQLAVAAVVAERERIGRDLHDILGHSLTAIAVKAGLARRLLESDPATAGVEIADVERLAREALADVRATASGYREVSLSGELAVAAAVLQASGIRAELPRAVDAVNPAAREVFGYVIREAVTNVVRHSGAGSCTVTLEPNSIEIVDDGPGPADVEHCGNGLPGLADRLAAVGGTIEAGPLSGGGFRVKASVPATARERSVRSLPTGEASGLPGLTIAAGAPVTSWPDPSGEPPRAPDLPDRPLSGAGGTER